MRQFKRYELSADYRETLKAGGIKLLSLPNYLFRWLIFDKMGLFATSPLRVLFSMLVIVAFGLVLVTDNFHLLSDIIYPYLGLS